MEHVKSVMKRIEAENQDGLWALVRIDYVVKDHTGDDDMRSR